MSAVDAPAETNAPTRIEFRGNESRWGALFYLGVGGAIVAYFVSKGGWTAIVGVGVFGSLFLLLAFGKAFGELDRSVHLAFDEEGVMIPQAFAKKVPWDAVKSYSFDTPGDAPAVLLHLVEPARFEPRVTNPLKTWLVTWYGCNLPLHGVACSYEEIENAFRRFAPQVRKV
ncbi:MULTISPECIES: hypothetical protein [unclassified Bosea (in: a-proteobacteria)]|uniref:hypothetical protein n=1 Tax=unclassified Bosea (in: a-proteobacteria) TaxID=2653178 RepID=UPI000F754122|nr:MULTISPECIES: hypothetical protein [unclassified Bosea (in: a-proteobacteria)]AZO76977.1 hypothetical protein BLM15_04635 [Bosea sp. Tri-49]RXT21814.1 hypothetical protein B5U98_15260 [Bosea sp. Tri-39]RXT32153.1 hypothetical protein B5U99_26105 [Bosea sp. Tri-54]